MRNGVTSMARIDYIERLNLLLRDPERKSIFQIIPELLAVWLRNRNTPSDYYQCLLFKKYMTNIYDFVGNNYGCKIRDSLNSPSWLCLLDNKLFFHLYFEGKGVRIPRQFPVYCCSRKQQKYSHAHFASASLAWVERPSICHVAILTHSWTTTHDVASRVVHSR
jgi:hypothetical protein